MPNCDFYATAEDHEGLLEWIFAEQACDVYELSSDMGEPLRQFRSAAQVLSQFERTYSDGRRWRCVRLQLCVHDAGPPFEPRRVALDPQACDGATFRHTADGWGLVQLYLETAAEGGARLENSHTNHNSLARAQAWAHTITDLGAAEAWDFARITSFSSRLNREIRKRGVARLGSRPMLPGALKLWNAGAAMGSYKPGEHALEVSKGA